MNPTTVDGADFLSLGDFAARLQSWLSDRREHNIGGSLEPADVETLVAEGAEFMASLYEAGWNRYGWPVTAGGFGGDARYRGVLYDVIVAEGFRLPEQVVALETLVPAVLKFAPNLGQRWLVDYLAGREFWSQGFSEPESGSDLASLRCRAQKVRASDRSSAYILNGQKTWTTLGHLTKRIAVLCRTGSQESRHRGLSLFMVDCDSPGVTIRPIRMSNGRNEFSEVFFDDVEVANDRLIGLEDEGWSVAMFLLQFERSMYAWQRQAWLIGRLERMRDLLDVSKFNSSEVQRKLASAYMAVAALRSRSGQTVCRLASSDFVGPEASVDKVLLATAEQSVLDVALDLLPAVFGADQGQESEEWRSSWFYTRAASIYGGSAEIQRTILADHVLGLPKEPR